MLIEKIKKRMLTTAGVFVISLLMTIIVALESKWIPWSPYFPVYAILAFWIPYKLGIWRPELVAINIFASIKHVFRKHWKFILAIFIFAEIWDIVSPNILYDVLTKIGLTGILFDTAINLMVQEAAIKLGLSEAMALGIYAVFIIGWAPFGEPVFYLGYVQKTLRKSHSFTFAALISASFFSVRHATHFLFLLPDYPIIAGLIWVLTAFVFGFLMSYLYEKTNSLYPPAIIHFIVNIASIVLTV